MAHTHATADQKARASSELIDRIADQLAHYMSPTRRGHAHMVRTAETIAARIVAGDIVGVSADWSVVS